MKRTTLLAPGKLPEDPQQSRAFIEKAREIGADEDFSRADEVLGRLAKMLLDPRSKNRTAH
jgi:hypothetical protein